MSAGGTRPSLSPNLGNPQQEDGTYDLKVLQSHITVPLSLNYNRINNRIELRPYRPILSSSKKRANHVLPLAALQMVQWTTVCERVLSMGEERNK